MRYALEGVLLALIALFMFSLTGCAEEDITFHCKGSKYIDAPVSSSAQYIVGGVVPTETRSTVKVGSCSGVRLDAHTVLTAAHCARADTVTVNGDEYPVTDKYIHPLYAYGPTGDLAVFRVQPAMPGPYPAGIYDPAAGGYDPDWRYNCERLVLEGYGRGSEGALHELEHVIVRSEWPTMWGESAYQPDTRAACGGDSGGPLYAIMDERFDNRYMVFGLAAWGTSSECVNQTGFTYLTLYKPYIKEVRRCLEGGEDRPWDFYIGGWTSDNCEDLRQ